MAAASANSAARSNNAARRHASKRKWLVAPLLCCSAAMSMALQASDPANPDLRVSEGAVFSAEQLAASLATQTVTNPATLAEPDTSVISGRHRPVYFSHEDTWISEIGTLLYTDNDHDGYFAGISLSIDADTHYTNIDVFASIDIQRQIGDREHLHTSNNFTLYNTSLADEYRIDIDLVRNYPIGNYDLFIDLHDASTGEILDRVGPTLFSNLRSLPLESEQEDLQTGIPVSLPEPEPPVNDDVRVVEYAGGTGTLLLALLGLITLSRRHPSGSKLNPQ